MSTSLLNQSNISSDLNEDDKENQLSTKDNEKYDSFLKSVQNLYETYKKSYAKAKSKQAKSSLSIQNKLSNEIKSMIYNNSAEYIVWDKNLHVFIPLNKEGREILSNFKFWIVFFVNHLCNIKGKEGKEDRVSLVYVLLMIKNSRQYIISNEERYYHELNQIIRKGKINIEEVESLYKKTIEKEELNDRSLIEEACFKGGKRVNHKYEKKIVGIVLENYTKSDIYDDVYKDFTVGIRKVNDIDQEGDINDYDLNKSKNLSYMKEIKDFINMFISRKNENFHRSNEVSLFNSLVDNNDETVISKLEALSIDSLNKITDCLKEVIRKDEDFKEKEYIQYENNENKPIFFIEKFDLLIKNEKKLEENGNSLNKSTQKTERSQERKGIPFNSNEIDDGKNLKITKFIKKQVGKVEKRKERESKFVDRRSKRISSVDRVLSKEEVSQISKMKMKQSLKEEGILGKRSISNRNYKKSDKVKGNYKEKAVEVNGNSNINGKVKIMKGFSSIRK